MSRHRVGKTISTFTLVSILLALVAAPTAVTEAGTAGSSDNFAVRIVVRMSAAPDEEPTSREYRMTLIPGEMTRIVHGRRLPIATTSFDTSQTSEGGIVPITSYTYQTVGFQAKLTAEEPTADGRILIHGSVEDSQVRRYLERAGQPEIAAVEQWVHVYVKPGETVVLHRSDSGQRKVEIRLQADRTG